MARFERDNVSNINVLSYVVDAMRRLDPRDPFGSNWIELEPVLNHNGIHLAPQPFRGGAMEPVE